MREQQNTKHKYKQTLVNEYTVTSLTDAVADGRGAGLLSDESGATDLTLLNARRQLVGVEGTRLTALVSDVSLLTSSADH